MLVNGGRVKMRGRQEKNLRNTLPDEIATTKRGDKPNRSEPKAGTGNSDERECLSGKQAAGAREIES